VTALKVALAGAPGTGKSKLLSALRRALHASACPAVIAITDPAAMQCGPAGCDLTLLMGLETSDQAMRAADQPLRAALARNGTAYQVLYGTPAERLAQALAIIEAGLPRPAGPDTPEASGQKDDSRKPWLWVCDKCSDPQCEHRLLSDLLLLRATAP
jgi:hypothetical protein